MDFTANELKPFFPAETESIKLEKLAEFVTVGAKIYFEQKELLKDKIEEEETVDKALKGIKAILRVETDTIGDYERYCQSTPDTDEFREPFAILTKSELVQAVQQAIANILRNSGHLSKGKNDQYDFEVSIEGFLEKQKTSENSPQPAINFITLILSSCRNLGSSPNK